jgi:hypothetical protein
MAYASLLLIPRDFVKKMGLLRRPGGTPRNDPIGESLLDSVIASEVQQSRFEQN